LESALSMGFWKRQVLRMVGSKCVTCSAVNVPDAVRGRELRRTPASEDEVHPHDDRLSPAGHGRPVDLSRKPSAQYTTRAFWPTWLRITPCSRCSAFSPTVAITFANSRCNAGTCSNFQPHVSLGVNQGGATVDGDTCIGVRRPHEPRPVARFHAGGICCVMGSAGGTRHRSRWHQKDAPRTGRNPRPDHGRNQTTPSGLRRGVSVVRTVQGLPRRHPH